MWRWTFGWSLVCLACLPTMGVAQTWMTEHDSPISMDEMERHAGFSEAPTYPLNPPKAYCWNWTDSLELFLGLDGSKQPQDFGVNAHFGGRAHINWGAPLSFDHSLGLQIGTAVTQTDHAVAVTHALEGSSSRTQSFTTIGLFQRADSGWNWALAWDVLYQQDYDTETLSQWRGRVGYDLTNRDEIGVMGSLPMSGSDANWAGNAVHLRPLAQGSFFWRHLWQYGSQTTMWLGAADSHGQENAALMNTQGTNSVVVFGADLHCPVSDHWAIFGEANFVTPADTGSVDAYLGFAFYPGGGALGWRRKTFSPLLPVAGSPTFVTDLSR
ncbi:DUF6666 family protein [Blastopirellula marina]|uniref:Secreted protein n=1 Tax=Blastopirellula marina DSM 3645 TaxID=314230 RepID=A3ZUT7_9BACT|nr:DUF6666 family protein [Blastopirellula marina]EAQ79673.1 hypothetical protein DSM3645_24230 [Blastopirellula marina DSM 3645]